MSSHTTSTVTPARAARRQNACDRIAEYLADKGADAERAAAWAPDLLDLVMAQGYALPAVLEDAPPPREKSETSGPGYAAFQAERERLAARRATEHGPT